jgi:hypothetical protein
MQQGKTKIQGNASPAFCLQKKGVQTLPQEKTWPRLRKSVITYIFFFYNAYPVGILKWTKNAPDAEPQQHKA